MQTWYLLGVPSTLPYGLITKIEDSHIMLYMNPVYLQITNLNSWMSGNWNYLYSSSENCDCGC